MIFGIVALGMTGCQPKEDVLNHTPSEGEDLYQIFLRIVSVDTIFSYSSPKQYPEYNAQQRLKAATPRVSAPQKSVIPLRDDAFFILIPFKNYFSRFAALHDFEAFFEFCVVEFMGDDG